MGSGEVSGWWSDILGRKRSEEEREKTPRETSLTSSIVSKAGHTLLHGDMGVCQCRDPWGGLQSHG